MLLILFIASKDSKCSVAIEYILMLLLVFQRQIDHINTHKNGVLQSSIIKNNIVYFPTRLK